MPHNNNFAVGHHSPVYLWAGPGTVRMNRLKFMDAPVDVFVHHEAHTPTGAKRMAEEAGFNWAYLMYDWGFPPEIEAEDWEAFRQAVPVYHQAGIKVFGYVQMSNCAHQGSFKGKDWYAQDPHGRPIYYYTGRYMTCWQHPDWLEHLREMVDGVIEGGADGIFFDNPWLGAAPLHFGGAWSGPAGCYCPRCRQTFQEETGLAIPEQIDPVDDPASREYLNWRADLVTETLRSLADYARSRNPEIAISANDYDAIMRPSFLFHGIDLRALAQIQDVVMIEDFSLPRWQPGVDEQAAELVNNTITLRTAQALIGDTPLSTDPYDKGIGFDNVYPPRRLQQGIAEAAACGATMVVKGTEYVDGEGVFTLLTAEQYKPERNAVKEMHQWLRDNAALYRERQNAARVGLLYPEEEIRFRWDQLAPLYFGVAQTLTYAGIPWQAVTPGDDWGGLETVLCFEQVDQPPPEMELIHVPGLARWTRPEPTFFARHRQIFQLLSRFLAWYYRAYFRYRWARRLTDRLGVTQWFLQSPHFRLPPEETRQTLLDALVQKSYPRVESSDAPVLIEVWQRGDESQIHLVNYGVKPQRVRVFMDAPAPGRILAPTREAINFSGSSIEFELDVYTLVVFNPTVRDDFSGAG
jgi:hypothetical protein